jgi:hypothetical protein
VCVRQRNVTLLNAVESPVVLAHDGSCYAHGGRRPESFEGRNRGRKAAIAPARRSRCGDFAASSDLCMAHSIGSGVNFAASVSRELRCTGAASVLRDEVMWF